MKDLLLKINFLPIIVVLGILAYQAIGPFLAPPLFMVIYALIALISNFVLLKLASYLGDIEFFIAYLMFGFIFILPLSFMASISLAFSDMGSGGAWN